MRERGRATGVRPRPAFVGGAVLVALMSGALSGCGATPTRSELVGVFEDADSGARVSLADDGAFTAEGVPGSAVAETLGDAPRDFTGSWDLVGHAGSSDFVYLGVEDDGLALLAGIQLYVRSDDAL